MARPRAPGLCRVPSLRVPSVRVLRAASLVLRVARPRCRALGVRALVPGVRASRCVSRPSCSCSVSRSSLTALVSVSDESNELLNVKASIHALKCLCVAIPRVLRDSRHDNEVPFF